MMIAIAVMTVMLAILAIHVIMVAIIIIRAKQHKIGNLEGRMEK